MQGESYMFSSVCLLHCVTNGPDFWTVTVNGESMQSALAKWYFSGASGRTVDTSCQGWACHANCKGEEEPALRARPPPLLSPAPCFAHPRAPFRGFRLPMGLRARPLSHGDACVQPARCSAPARRAWSLVGGRPGRRVD